MNQTEKLTILHIANLSSDKSKGPNTNVPKNIIYGNKYANVGLYNLQDAKLAIRIPEDKFFKATIYKSIKRLPKPFNRPNLVIFQGVYFPRYCQIAKWLRKNSIPYIIVPRCSMTTAAIKSHILKKKLANLLFFNKFIRSAEKIQFLTKNEYEESKNNFKFKNYFILGNGVELPNNKYKVKNRDEFRIVFVGRYNVYHKGLDILLDSISENRKWFEKNKASLLLYGSDSDNGLAYLEKRVADDKLSGIVKICGPAFGEEKEKALLDADIFIHTSRLEGQPTSVIEAISYGIPVLVTPGTNVVDIVKKNKLGFWANSDSVSIMNSIKSAYDSKRDYHNITKNELKYANDNFDWANITKQTIDVYKTIIANETNTLSLGTNERSTDK